MKLFIQHIKSEACIQALKNILKEAGLLHMSRIELGELVFSSVPKRQKINLFKTRLQEHGYAFVQDRKKVVAEKIKAVVETLIAQRTAPEENYSQYIRKKLQLNYSYLANVFSQTEGMTLEQYIIQKKIEQSKWLLASSGMNISEISNHLNYRSLAHFCNQFKKVTGLTPSAFRKNSTLAL